jgi:hypothetical protein
VILYDRIKAFFHLLCDCERHLDGLFSSVSAFAELRAFNTRALSSRILCNVADGFVGGLSDQHCHFASVRVLRQDAPRAISIHRGG